MVRHVVRRLYNKLYYDKSRHRLSAATALPASTYVHRDAKFGFEVHLIDERNHHALVHFLQGKNDFGRKGEDTRNYTRLVHRPQNTQNINYGVQSEL